QEEDSLPLPAPAPGRLVHRHVRTIREVKITRVITDVYYVNGKEVERRVTEEAEAPIVERQEYEQSTTSPSRTVSSLTSGDLADVSSLSTKVSNGTGSLQRTGSSTSGGGHSSVSLNRSGSGDIRGSGRAVFEDNRGKQSSKSTLLKVQAGRGCEEVWGEGARVGYSRQTHSMPRTTRGKGRGRGHRAPSRYTEWEEIAGDGDAGDEDDADPIEPEPTAEWTLVADRGPQVTRNTNSLLGNIEKKNVLPQDVPVVTVAGEGSNSGSSSLVGLRVVAKWSSNEYFYSGRVVGEREAGRCRVRFDDGYECDVAGRDVLLCDPIPLHTQVTALSHDEYFSAGQVSERFTEGSNFFDADKPMQHMQCTLHKEGILLIATAGNMHMLLYSNVSVQRLIYCTFMVECLCSDNLVEGKRQRRLGTAAEGRSPTTQAARQPQSPRVVPSTGKRRLQLTDQGSSDVGSPAKRGRKTTSAKHSSSGGSSPCKSIGGHSPTHSLTEERPVPQACPSSELFCGYSFVLTVSTPADRVYCRPPRFSTDESSGTEEEQAAVPYDYAAIEAQIRAAGGTVLQNLNPTLVSMLCVHFFSGQVVRCRPHYRCGYPLLMRHALHDTCPSVSMRVCASCIVRPAKLSPHPLLIMPHETRHGQKNLFEDTRVLLVSEDHESFLDLWSEILMAAKAATVTCHKPTPNYDVAVAKYDLLVSDASCPPGMLHCAAALEMPVVSSEWLVQCLVTGHRVPFTSHPAFRHDHRPV
uniref:BRCT domain-containing protein n=1 Tax=Petromyzon marinus TaxID=7757 RepID=S4RQX0_PETMA